MAAKFSVLSYARRTNQSSHGRARVHIIRPSDATRSMCGLSLTDDGWFVRGMGAGERTCGACERMRNAALEEARAFAANREARHG
jgi:hypothetical protein